jgi:hypothetical protein
VTPTIVGKVGGWTFYEVTGMFEGRILYGFGDGSTDENGRPEYGELYDSIEWAMASAIAEKHTGKRGAGGTGVGTAADWFMRMIGAGQLQEAGPEGGRALVEAVSNNRDKGLPLAANRIERELEAKGYLIARQAR